MRRMHQVAIGVIPIGIIVFAFAALAGAAPLTQEVGDPAVSACEATLHKIVTPDSLLLGGTAKVTLVMTHTCPGEQTPVDIMFLVDESNSMTRAEGEIGPPPPGDPTRTPPPDPLGRSELDLPIAGFDRAALSALLFSLDQDPGPEPPGPGEPGPGPGSGEPPGCGDDASGPGDPPGPTPGGPGLPLASRLVPTGIGLGDSPDQRRRTPTPTATPTPRTTPTPIGGGSEEPGGSEDLIREVQAWLREFVDDERIKADIDSGGLRLGLVSFNSRADTIVRLSEYDQAYRVSSLASRLRGMENTRIDLGFERAKTELDGRTSKLGGKTGRKQFVVILSDGSFCQRDAHRVRDSTEFEIATVSFGRSSFVRRLDDMASERRYAFTSRRLGEFIEMYRDQFASSAQHEIARLVIEDELRENIRLVPGSAVPAPSEIDEQTIRWDGLRSGEAVTTTPRITISSVITVGYEIEPLEPGNHFVSYDALARWRDTANLPGGGTFPPVVVDVIAPTPTPTQTSTSTPTDLPDPTATPTPTPQDRYFPVAFKPEPPKPEVCTPEKQKIDVVLVVDTSTSMNELVPGSADTKLSLAVTAAKALVSLLKLPDSSDGDQAAVVGFNSAAFALTGLSGDRATINAALDALSDTSDSGTRIDAGLNAAIDELASERRNPGSTASIVIVTDGRHSGASGTGAVLDAADRARSLGLVVFAVGLGSDIDEGLLRLVATVPDNYRAAPDASDLVLIYEAIAKEIPCP